MLSLAITEATAIVVMMVNMVTTMDKRCNASRAHLIKYSSFEHFRFYLEHQFLRYCVYIYIYSSSFNNWQQSLVSIMLPFVSLQPKAKFDIKSNSFKLFSGHTNN